MSHSSSKGSSGPHGPIKTVPIEEYQERLSEVDADLRSKRQVTVKGKRARVTLGLNGTPQLPDSLSGHYSNLLGEDDE